MRIRWRRRWRCARFAAAMDLTFRPEHEAFRAEARAWLAEHVPAEPLPSFDTAEGFEAHRAWERTMYEDRWSVVSWPTEYGGRDLGIFEWLVFEEEYYRARAPKRVSQNGIFLLAPTMLEYGTEAQKARYPPAHGRRRRSLVPGLVGTRRRQRPRRHPLARHAQRGRGRVGPRRSEDVGQPGRVRRVVLRDLPHRPRGGAPPRPDLLPRRHGLARRHGAAHPPDRRRDGLRRDLLRPGGGALGSSARRGRRGLDGRHGDGGVRAWALAAQSGALHRGGRPPGRALPPARRPARFCRRGGACPHRRRGLPVAHVLDRVAGGQGRALGAEASCNKIWWSETDVAIHTAALDLLGHEAELLQAGAPGEWLDGYLFSLAGPIYAGTNEIQRNVVAERLLGLPRG